MPEQIGTIVNANAGKLRGFVAHREAQAAAELAAKKTSVSGRKVGGVNVSEITGVVLPERPVFDKIVAFFLFLAFGLRMEMEEIAELILTREREDDAENELGLSFWGGSRFYRGRTPQGHEFTAGGNRPTDAQQRRWHRSRVYQIDVGANKYQDRGTASAAECVALDCGLIQKWGLERLFEATHEWVTGTKRGKRHARCGIVWDTKGGCEVSAHEVVDQRVSDSRERVALHYVLLASRNNGTGYLKESNNSIVYLLRELQKPEVLSQADIDRGWTVWTIPGIVRFVLDVLGVDFQVRVGLIEGAVTLPKAGTLKEHTAYGKFFQHQEAAGSQFADFNFASYLRGLIALGTPEETIVAIGDAVIDTVISQTFEQKKKARECLEICGKEPFGGGLGMMLISDDPAIANNPRVVREMWRAFPLVRIAVVINSREQVSILTDGSVPLDAAAKQLQKMEPQRWFYDPRIGAILNGGHSFTKVPPTQVALSEIIGLLEAVIYKAKTR